jgi:hypothetical protein
MMVYCIYLDICLNGSAYIILNIPVLNYMEKAIMALFPVRWFFSWRFNTVREKYFPDGPESSGKSLPTRKIIFPWRLSVDRENKNRQGKHNFLDGVHTVRVKSFYSLSVLHRQGNIFPCW